MIFQEKHITLKNGQTAVLKTPEITDAEKMLNYIITASGETDFLLRYPEEWESTTVEQEEKWVESSRNSPNALVITCFIDGKVAGNCDIRFYTGIKSRHRAMIGIAVLKNYWNLGIGSAMFQEMINAAQTHGSEILELEFIEGNERARCLYEKFGFRIVSHKPDAFRLKDGTMRKEFYMQKRLTALD